MDLARSESDAAKVAEYKERGFKLLSAVADAGLRDPTVDAKLARLLFEANRGSALAVAERTVGYPDVTPSDRSAALFVVGAERLRGGRPADALTAFRELVTLRRHPHDWLLTAECEKQLGHAAAAAAAVDAAARINPRLKRDP